MAEKLTSGDWRARRVAGWRDRGGRQVTAWTLFLIVTGLTIHLLPFSVFNQHAVVLHTLVGIVVLWPTVTYLVRHVKAYWHFPGTHVKFTGWGAGAMLLPCAVSGVALTFEAALGTRITTLWRMMHIVTTYGLLVLLGAHLIALYVRAGRGSAADPELATAASSHGRAGLGWTGLGLVVTAALALVLRPVPFTNAFPDDYDHEPYAGAGPFSPSLATTATGGAFDARSLADSASCGVSGCHEEIYQEWLPSAHRYASLDAGFQKIQSVMAQQNGATSTRYCGGCHDPISLFSGTKNIGVEDLTGLHGYQEGISCMACHAIEQTDVAGNANYVMSQPGRYVWELRDGPVADFLERFLIRAYPDQHVESLSRRMFKAPEFCAACHKQFIDEEVNQVGWVQLQNQYDNWKGSRWHTEGDPSKTLECRECHMPLVDSTDPAAGDAADANRSPDDGKHRSHRFLGGNQFIPKLQDLPHGDEHVRLTEAWLRGEVEIPEIADRWREGPAVPLELEVAEEVAEGEELRVAVHLINNKVGHDFPTGPLDIIQAWVEVEVVDAAGREIFRSGHVDEANRIDPGTFMFKAEPVDRYGNLIDRHNLWEMVGVRFKRSLFPGAEEVASYSFTCAGTAAEVPEGELGGEVAVEVPAEIEGPLTVRARLRYRKFDQYLLDFAFPDSGLTSPITDMSSAEATVRLRPAGR